MKRAKKPASASRTKRPGAFAPGDAGVPGGELRIIAGAWRSRRIVFPHAPGLRPTSDRIRETLFNWLGHDLSGFRCLDLYAGSGALGFEALSRGAERVVMVEHNPAVVRVLEENAGRLNANGLQIIRADALEFLQRDNDAAAGRGGRFDVVFLDPPFDAGLPARVLELLPTLLAPGGRVYVEADRLHDLPPAWLLEKRGRAGQVHFQLMRWDAG